MPHHLEIGMIHEFDDVALGAGKEVIYTDNIMAFIQEGFTQMPAQKTRSTCNQYSLHLILSVFPIHQHA